MNSRTSVWDDFTNQSSISKTIRFALNPVGKTEETIKKIKLIENDKQRDKDFKEIKKIMDRYYKFFIDTELEKITISKTNLKEVYQAYSEFKKDKKLKKNYNNYKNKQKEMRTNLHKILNNNNPELNKKLFGKDFIPILKQWGKQNKELSADEIEMVDKFKNWITYFKGFFDNRKNVFSEKDIPTSIFYRIFEDNFPKYMENYEKFEKLKELDEYTKTTKTIEEDFKEELEGKSLREFISIENYNNFFTQKGIDKYNLIIGGRFVENEKEKRVGLNELINKLSQNNKEKSRFILKQKFSPLYKQILSDRVSTSFYFEGISNKNEVIEEIDCFNEQIKFEEVNKIILNLNNSDLTQVYLNSKSLPQISMDLYNEYNSIKDCIEEYANEKFKTKKEKDNFLKQNYYSINLIETVLNKYNRKDKNPILNYFLDNNEKEMLKELNFALKEYDILKAHINQNKKTSEVKNNECFDEKEVEILKKYLDLIKELQRFIAPFYISNKEKISFEEDPTFYSEYNEFYENVILINKLYDKVRNFTTKKPFSINKFKLNFENTTLLDGWDENKIRDNYATIFRKNKIYYLGISTTKNNAKEFNKYLDNLPNCKDESYEVLIYKLIPDLKSLNKIFFAEKHKGIFDITPEVYKIKEKKAIERTISEERKLIDFYKENIPKYENWKYFDFKFKNTNEYNTLQEFYKDFENAGYKIKFGNISEKYIDELVENEKMCLFKIWNKDFSEFSKGKKNLHTIYWENLFSEENLKEFNHRLSGKGELFFREKSIPQKITHKKDNPIKNKNENNKKKESTFGYDLIKDKRYTKDQYLFYCSIKLNSKQVELEKVKLNELILKHIQNNKVNILSIDRGERHLLYYTLLNSTGEILKQGSGNTINTINYHNKLDFLEKERKKQRVDWKKISNIKEMKEGYLSLVIHEISKMAIENNAIIVLENLNSGFKNSRVKIEKQIYQKFEKMLINKLNYLVFKNRNAFDTGGIFNAYQLTPEYKPKNSYYQTGIIFYVYPSYTSKICPATGFVSLIYPKFKNIKDSKEFFNKFEYIKYNKSRDLFEFNFNISDFCPDYKKKLVKDNWSVWSNGIKITSYKNKEKNQSWDYKEIQINKDLINLFKNYKIDYISEKDLKELIVNQSEKEFFEKLTNLLKFILQLRNYNNSGKDYILSCVMKNKKFFSSEDNLKDFPENADANGAYHIGLKGLMLIDKIRNSKENKFSEWKISNEEYFNYAIEKAKLKKL